jgi:hypothetical protein
LVSAEADSVAVVTPAAIIAPNLNHFIALLRIIWSSSPFANVRLCRTVPRLFPFARRYVAASRGLATAA